MKKDFSRMWKSSSSRRKQRKYRYNSPLHIKNKFMSSHLSKELRQKHKTRHIAVRKGDSVKIMRGQFSGKTGKIDRVNIKMGKVYITGIDFTKKDGTKRFYPFEPSNIMITELDLNDKKRLKRIKRM